MTKGRRDKGRKQRTQRIKMKRAVDGRNKRRWTEGKEGTSIINNGEEKRIRREANMEHKWRRKRTGKGGRRFR